MNRKTRQVRQNIDNLKGEIAFRAKLSRQHVTGEVLLTDYYTKQEHDRILLERVASTRRKIQELADLGVGISPFLELGAERGQRSLVLANDFNATGVASDISCHQLNTMGHFSRLFERDKLPVRVCCDANHLPFRNNSFPFIFCYEFLHHFPSLGPVMHEIHRVLAGGYFYFDEEPFERTLKLVLYRQRSKTYSSGAFRKNRYVRLLESFISEAASDEVEHGIIENNDISLLEWLDAVSIFDSHDVYLFSINNISSRLGDHLTARNVPNFLLGGSIAGLCRKAGPMAFGQAPDISAQLGCPDCTIPLTDGSFDRPPLERLANGFRCSQCGSNYPSREGVIFLLPRAELQQLYPELEPSR